MKCRGCGNTKEFTIIREIGYWDDIDKMFKDTDALEEYIMCGECNSTEIDDINY